jgi:zinc transport system substrate-binding protein
MQLPANVPARTKETRMNRLITASLAAASIVVMSHAAQAAPKVIASIKPVHSLVAGVMDGIGVPTLLVEGGGSPHTYSLKPSQASGLEQADIIFWIGGQLEAFLEKPVATIGAKARSVELAHGPGLTMLEKREGGPFEAHVHHDDDHDRDHKDTDHKEHAEHKDDDHDHEKKHEHEHEEHVGGDLHIWLDPENAKAMVRVIAGELMHADAANAARYRHNADAMLKLLEHLNREIASNLAPLKDRQFIVFHDAYQYFEHRFGLHAAGSITVSPETLPGAERIREIKGRIAKLGAACVFTEPQFEPKLVRVVTEGTAVKTGVLDPLGADIADGPKLYFTLIRNMAASMRGCLTSKS